jgi:ABC-2 type transport system permease protein
VSAIGAFGALSRAGFQRYSTYRQATAAAIFTNSVFGFLRTYVLLAAFGANAVVAGYDKPQMTTFVWVGQGVIGVVLLWGWTEVAERVRTGDIAADLLRPINPLWAFLAADFGRAGHAALTRLVVPVLVGAVFFDLRVPARLVTYPLFAVSLVLAVAISFCARYMVNLSAFWLLDARGVTTAYAVASGVLSGLILPVRFYPGWLEPVLWATPFPWLLQAPLDVACERGSLADQLGLVSGQVCWVVGLLVAASLMQRRAVHKLVVQGG